MNEIGKSDLQSVEEFKQLFKDRKQELIDFAENGGQIFIYTCFLPKAIIGASGAQVVKLLGMMNIFGYENSLIDEYFPHGKNEFCTLINGTFGVRLKKPYPKNMRVTDGTPCATLTKLVSWMHMGMPEFGDAPCVINVPRRSCREVDRKFFYGEMIRLKEFCEKLTGNTVTNEKLFEEIRIENKKKRLVKELDMLRKDEKIPIKGSECILVNQQQNWLEMSNYLIQLEKVIEEVKERKKKGVSVYAADAPRVIVTDPCFFEPFRGELEPLQNVTFLEECGAAVIAEDFCTGVGEHWSFIKENENHPDQVQLYADYYLNEIVPCPFRTPNLNRIKKCKEAIDELNIEGVIYMTTHACKVASAESVKFERAMDEIGIPTLPLERFGDPAKELTGQLRIRVETFLTMLKERRKEKEEQK
jgi:benzoyl-CoA reductase/2-hydroxyglutaryl-CoA dehydratase subunit BcrC/BadD/HgdB